MENKNIKKIKVKGSFGEQVIQNILEYNNIYYIKEYFIVNDVGRNQRMDFFVTYNNVDYCIEYNGEHHYIDIEYWDSNVKEVQERDKNKKAYCDARGINYIAIPYTCNTEVSIFNYLKKYIPKIKRPKEFTINKGVYINIQDMLNYYYTRSGKDTANKYNISEGQLTYLLGSIGRRSKRIPVDLINVYKNESLVLTGTYHEIKENIPDIEVKNLFKCLNGDMDTTSGYSFSYIDKYKDKERTDNIKKRKQRYKNINHNRRGSSKKKVTLLNIFTLEEYTYYSVKDCYTQTGLNKHKVYKLFNPNKDTVLIDKYVGIYEDGTLSLNIPEAQELFKSRGIQDEQ